MRISVLVINYNGERHLAQLVAALQAQTLRDFELIFIDNASVDGSLAFMHQLCDESPLAITLLSNTENTGFAPACNQGIRAARGEWIALLNNDAFPEPGWLEYLWNASQDSPRLGMVAAKLLFAHEPARINSAGIAIDRAGIAWDWRGGELDQPEESGPVEIFGPCGGAALYSLIWKMWTWPGAPNWPVGAVSWNPGPESITSIRPPWAMAHPLRTIFWAATKSG